MTLIRAALWRLFHPRRTIKPTRDGWWCLLVAVGLSSGALSKLPRAGNWMVWVKRFFAVLMLAVAEYYLIEMGKLVF